MFAAYSIVVSVGHIHVQSNLAALSSGGKKALREATLFPFAPRLFHSITLDELTIQFSPT